MSDTTIPSAVTDVVAALAVIIQPSGDTTGVADTEAVNAALMSVGTGPGVVRLTAGTYYLVGGRVSTFAAGQGLVGAGKAQTTIKAVGAGDLIRACDAAPWVSFASSTGGPRAAGRFAGFTLDGEAAGAGSAGMHVGDLLGLDIQDVRVQNFDGSNSRGLWLDCVTTWAERSRLEVELNNNRANVVFDNHIPDNPYSFASYGYSHYSFTMTTHPDQHGVVVRNGASLVGVDMTVRGNFLCGDATNAGVAFSVGEDDSGRQSMILGSRLDWQVETDGVGVPHKPIGLGANAAAIAKCHGVLHFLDGNGQAFSDADLPGGSILGFNGVVHLPGAGGSAWGQGGRSIGTWTGTATRIYDGVAYPSSGNYIHALLTHGVNDFAWDAGGLADMKGQSCTWEVVLEQPARADATVSWPDSFRWLGGSPPTLTSAPGGADHVRVVTFDFVAFYAQHLGAY